VKAIATSVSLRSNAARAVSRELLQEKRDQIADGHRVNTIGMDDLVHVSTFPNRALHAVTGSGDRNDAQIVGCPGIA
jgi:hypothetical protein